MYRIRCAEVWGGNRDEDSDVCSAGITASLYARACEGGRGGDIHYVSVCGDDLLTRIAVADVAGHGTAVARVSEWLYRSLEARMGELGCESVLRELNDLAASRGIQALTSAAVVAFYTRDAELYYAYAGHAPMLVRRRDQAEWRPAPVEVPGSGNANAPLGVLAGAGFDEASRPFETGDRLLLYTDGLAEARNAAGEEFGEAGLGAVLEAHGDGPLHELKAALLDAARNHAGGELDHDDVTLLAAEVNDWRAADPV